MVPTNTQIFSFARFKTMRRKQNFASALSTVVSKKKIRGNHTFFRDNKASIWKKNAIDCFVFYCFLE